MSALVQPQETNPEIAPSPLFEGPLPRIRRGITRREAAEQANTAIDLVELSAWHSLSPAEKREAYRLPEPSQLELDFRHSFWHADRMKTLEAFARTSTKQSRVDRFTCCGGAARIQVAKDNGESRVVSNKCHDRFCKACGNERQHVIKQNLLTYCEKKELRFVTLTLKHNSERLTLQIDRLFSCFTRLRERVFWKSRVKGGAVFFELKPSKDGRTWHPHLHIITEGGFMPRAMLSSEWLAVTGDSMVSDVRFVHDAAATLGYVAKYASKPLDGSLYHWPSMLDEAIVALQGRRACTTIGAWRGLKLEDKPEDDREWIDVGSMDQVRQHARDGSLFHQTLCIYHNIDRTWAEAENGDTS